MEPHLCTGSACGRGGRGGGASGGRDGGEQGQAKFGDHGVGKAGTGSCVGPDLGHVYHSGDYFSSVVCE